MHERQNELEGKYHLAKRGYRSKFYFGAMSGFSVFSVMISPLAVRQF
jgi:hypothetical protein